MTRHLSGRVGRRARPDCSKDGYYAKDDPAHREASRWAGKGAETLGLAGPVDPDTSRQILEGKVLDGPQLGRRGPGGEIQHRPSRDVTLSAPKSVSLLAMVGGDDRIVDAHDHKGGLHAAQGLDHGRHWTTDAALARESETIDLMRAGQGAEKAIMRGWVGETKLHRGRRNEGQKAAAKTILAAKDQVIGVQGYAVIPCSGLRRLCQAGCNAEWRAEDRCGRGVSAPSDSALDRVITCRGGVPSSCLLPRGRFRA